MRIFLLAILGFLLSGCASLTAADKSEPLSLSPKTLAAGECGLYIWAADRAKTFTLFASPREITYLKAGQPIALIENNPPALPATKREFVDAEGKRLNLTLLSPEIIDGGTRYKSGRLTSLSDDGWEKVMPIVGLYACQPIV